MKIVLGLLLSCLLVACSAPQPPLRVGLVEWPPNKIALLANQMGYQKDYPVELVDFKSLSDASRAYASGNLDAVTLTLDYVLDLYARDAEHQAFLVIDESLGGDTVIAEPSISGLKQLAGKRVGLENGALGAYMLHRMLDKAGLKLSDVQPVYVDYDNQAAALLEGRVDAVVTGEPARTALLKAGKREIFSSRDIPGEIVDVFLARKTDLDRNGAAYRSFAQGWFDALAYFEANPAHSAEIMGPTMSLSAADFLATFDGVRMISLEDNRRMLGDDSAMFRGNIARFAELLKTMGRQDIPHSLGGVLTDSALPKSVEKRP